MIETILRCKVCKHYVKRGFRVNVEIIRMVVNGDKTLSPPAVNVISEVCSAECFVKDIKKRTKQIFEGPGIKGKKELPIEVTPLEKDIK